MTPLQQEVTFEANGETLAGRFMLPTNSSHRPRVLFLHGAGKATKERALPIAVELAQSGIASFSFDFSGHGTSSGKLSESSLHKRLNEAEAALTFAQFGERPSVCAFSMGGHIALQLLEDREIGALLLFYPAVYADEAYDLPFGDQRFTEVLRRPGSWQSSHLFPLLGRFSGNFLMVVGERDDVIPSEVIAKLDGASSTALKKRVIVVPDAPHLLLPALYADSALFGSLCDTAADFVTSS